MKRWPIPESGALERDRRLALSAAALTSALSARGVHDYDLLLALEAAVGGMSFGVSYFRVSLGLRHALEERNPPRTPDGRALLCWAVHGDTSVYVTDSGEVWDQDGISDREPLRRAPDVLTYVADHKWPIVDAVAHFA